MNAREYLEREMGRPIRTGSGGTYQVEQRGSWFTVTDPDGNVSRVRGQAAVDAIIEARNKAIMEAEGLDAVAAMTELTKF